jgi:malonyl-CoA O-methyltransferase
MGTDALEAAYALWAPTYPPTAHNPLMRTEQDVLRGLLAALRPRRALDVGTGSGRYLRELEALGASLVVGLDLSEAMLGRSEPGSVRVRADARQLPFAPSSFDLVTACLMAGDIADVTPWIAELASALAPEGHLLYTDFHPTWRRYGWRRTFMTGGGREIDLPYVPHALDDHRAAIERAGLELVALREVPLHDSDDEDVKAFRRRWGNPPVLTVVHGRKKADALA